MSTSIASVGFSELEDSFQAGFEAARQASSAVGNHSGWKLALLFSTSRHDPLRLQEGVQSVIGRQCRLIGGYAVGIITNETYGYDGFQVGLLLISPSGKAGFEVFAEGCLADNEAVVGEKLAEKINSHELAAGYPSLILLYDAVNRLSGRFKMNMATYVLDGMKKGMAWPPNLVGAGMVGDMQCRETFQWHDNRLHQQTAIALALSGSLRTDAVIMHGCRPASRYHTVTKAEGNVVLEIDGVPALDKISELLGPDSGKTWRDYSFFVTLGVNRGEKFGAFVENNYANRLCMGVDPDCKGLVMFEPDLVPGSEIQLMRRDVNFDYICEKIDGLMAKLGKRKPVFALYIDCAGRAAAYSGLDNEDAEEVQRALGDIPLLGFYTGVEIGPVAGEPMALDWTGVLAIVSEGEPEASPPADDAAITNAPVSATGPESAADISEKALEERIHDAEAHIEVLLGERDYYAGLSDELAGKNVNMDSQVTVLNHRLHTKKQGFAILAGLRDTQDKPQPFESLCRTALEEINAQLNMDKTIVLQERDGAYRPASWSGFTEAEVFSLEHVQLPPDANWLADDFLIGKRATRSNPEVQRIRNATRLPYFVCVTIREAGEISALLLAGRMKEAMPFYPPLEDTDASTLITIGAFLSATDQLNRERRQIEELSAMHKGGCPKPKATPDTKEVTETQTDAATDESDAYVALGADELRQRLCEADAEIDRLKHEADYYGALADELAGQNVKKDSNLSATKSELRIKREGFAILSDLQSRLDSEQTLENLCPLTIKAINTTLNMDRSLILFENEGAFRPAFWSGFAEMEVYDLEDIDIPMDKAWMEDGFILANRRTSRDEAIVKLRQFIGFKYFIGVPIREEGKTIGLLISGRNKEAMPFYPPLEAEDVNTFASIAGFLSSTNQMNRQREHLQELNQTLDEKVKDRTSELSNALGQLEVRNRFIRKTFGRYMSDDVVEKILETPDGLDLCGQLLPVTVLFSDLRGFSAISESHPPDGVVEMLNIYLEEMTAIVFRHGGTINELMGDGLLIVFGAPTPHEDDSDCAIACAIEMQLAMNKVNARITAKGFPELDMGIGINSGQVVAGNVGSEQRTKYAIVGNHVNMAARVESFTVGGQILATQSTIDACQEELDIGGEFSTTFKGIKEPVVMHEIIGVDGKFKLKLPERTVNYRKLVESLSVSFEVLKGKTAGSKAHKAKVTALAEKNALLATEEKLAARSNIKLNLSDKDAPYADFHAKVLKKHDDGMYSIHFTYMPREVRIYLDDVPHAD